MEKKPILCISTAIKIKMLGTQNVPLISLYVTSVKRTSQTGHEYAI